MEENALNIINKVLINEDKDKDMILRDPTPFEKELQGYAADHVIDQNKIVEFLKKYKSSPEELLEKLQKSDFLQNVQNISEDEYIRIYREAHHNFEIGEYKKAAEQFFALNALDYARPDCWMSFANCCVKLDKFEEALKGYMFAYMLNTSDPSPLFYSIPILLQRDEISIVREVLKEVIHLAKEDHAYRKMEDDAKKYEKMLFN